MKAGWIIGLVVAAVAIGVYALAPFGSGAKTLAPGSAGAAGSTAVAGNGGTAAATLETGTSGPAGLEADRARQPAALSGEVRDPNRAEPALRFGEAGDAPSLVEFTQPLPLTDTPNDNTRFVKDLETRYRRASSAQRLDALESLNRRYEAHLAGKTPEGEKELDELQLERLQLEMEWLVQNPGS